VRQEQYIDFLTNRRFRRTMLCHADVPISRDVTSDRLEGSSIVRCWFPRMVSILST